MTTGKSDIQARGLRIRYIREKLLELSREDFCVNFAYTPQSLKAWELSWGGGLNEDRAKDLVAHLKKLGIYSTASWLMHGIGDQPAPMTNECFVSQEDDEHIAKELLVFRELSNTIDTIIDDDSMAPFLLMGDYVAGVVVSNPLLAVDNICIITDNNEKVYVRMLKKGSKENFYHLETFNKTPSVAKEIKNIPIKSAAPILWIRKRKRHTPTHLDPW
jgi:hypothetical protein